MSVSKHKPIHIKLTFNQNQFSQTQLYQNQFSLPPIIEKIIILKKKKIINMIIFYEKSDTINVTYPM